jgi:histidinol-phosphate aminotransferase
LEPYSSARDEYDGTEGIFLDANENSFGLEYNRYPDPYQLELKTAIAKWRNVDPESIFIGNGSDEIIDLLIRSTCSKGNDRILCLDPSYGMYKVSAAINEIPLDMVGLREDFSIDEDALFDRLEALHKLIFICSPNNPNGGTIDPAIIERILKRSKGLVIIDEAYIDFSDTTSWISRLTDYENLIILQTFSKSLGAAGIRLGMAFMRKEIVTFLNKIKPPYNISVPNQKAALTRMEEMSEVKTAVKKIVAQRSLVQKALLELPFVVKVFASQANFLLVRFKNAGLVFNHLKFKKIIVRDRSKQKNCEDCLRITIGTEEENITLLEALKELNGQMNSTA